MADDNELQVANRIELRTWLGQASDRIDSVWLVRPHAGQPGHIPMHDITQECLCHGWVDSAVRKRDAHSSALRLSPRRPGSAWSAVNKRLVAAAERDGLMTDRGRAAIERAKQDGSWTFLDDVEAGIIPDDLATALEKTGARAMFEAFPRSSRRGILEWIKQAKRPETRAQRIAETARLAAKNIRALSPEAKGA